MTNGSEIVSLVSERQDRDQGRIVYLHLARATPPLSDGSQTGLDRSPHEDLGVPHGSPPFHTASRTESARQRLARNLSEHRT